MFSGKYQHVFSKTLACFSRLSEWSDNEGLILFLYLFHYSQEVASPNQSEIVLAVTFV